MGITDVTYPKLWVPLSPKSLQHPPALSSLALTACDRNLPDTFPLPTEGCVSWLITYALCDQSHLTSLCLSALSAIEITIVYLIHRVYIMI